ncbi:MAG: two-component regulator propeller domain-containing protein [Rikenellaceae bacterium]
MSHIITRVKVIALLLYVTIISATAANINFETPFKILNNRVGLPSDTIIEMCHDKNGFIWIATNEGLCRYDGCDIKSYSPLMVDGAAIKNTNIKGLHCDTEGYIWIATIEGAYLFNPVTESLLTIDNDRLSSTNITDIEEDREGRIWIATQKHIFKITKQNGAIESIEEMKYVDHYTKRQNISNLFCDSKGDMWIGFWSNGFMRHRTISGEFEFYSEPNMQGISTIYEDEDGSIYMGIWSEGIVRIEISDDPQKRFSIERLDFPRKSLNLNKAIVKFIERDNTTGCYWVGTLRGIFILNTLNDCTSMRVINSGSMYNQLSNAEVSSVLYSDQENILWFGTFGGGVCRINLEPIFIRRFLLDHLKDLFGSVTVRSIYDDGKKQWIGIKGGGMVMRDISSGEFTQAYQIEKFEGLLSNVNAVNAIYPIKSRSEIWLGTRYGGVISIKVDAEGNPQSSTLFKNGVNGDIGAKTIYAIYEDRHGRVWVGTNSGLYCAEYRDETWQFQKIALNDKYQTGRINAIAGDKMGRIWVALKSKSILSFSDSTPLDDNIDAESHAINVCNMTLNSVETIYCDSESRVWAGTSGLGLLLCSKSSGEFHRVEEQSLGEITIVNSIIESDDNELWIASSKGLFRCSGYGTDELSVLQYTYDDGLAGNTFVSNSLHKNTKGELYFGGYNGFSVVNPKNSHTNHFEPKVVLTNITVCGESIMYPNIEGEAFIRRNESGEVAAIELPYDSNSLCVEFSALSHSNSDKNRYQYRLDGLSSEWQEVSAQDRQATYNNLDYGRYTLRVRATNDSNIFSPHELSLKIYIKPPIYATWWAYLIYIMVVVLIIYFVTVTVIEKIRYRNRLLIESHKQQQLEELNESKLQFFTNISHEFLTPLSIISCGIEDMESHYPNDADNFHIMRNNVSRLMRMLEQILEFRKAESSNLKLKVGYGNLKMWVEKLAQENFTPLVRQRNYDFTVRCNSESIYGWFDRDKLDKMLYNLISNAIKYNYEGGFIRINLDGLRSEGESNYSSIRISVHNSGGVISEEQMKSLFKRFYDGEFRRYGTKGNGIGLSLTHNLVELHKGTIEVKSSEDSGTCFIITLPISESAFSEEQIDRQSYNATQQEDPTTDALANQFAPMVEEEDDLSDEIPTLLYVEDDTELSQMMVSLLNREYNVVHARNGREGLEQAIALNPSVIVSDVMMPDMDGFEMCRSLRNEIATSHIPIILVSAKISADDKVEGLKAGAQAYLTKPLQPKVLYAQIETLLNNQSKSRGEFKHNKSNIAIAQMEYTSVDEQLLMQAIDIVTRNIDNSEFEIKDFLDAMGMTNSMLYRKLKSLTGLSPNEFVRNIRLKAAYNLITEKYDSVTISEVAYAVGFNIPKYFTLCFKREYGYTPSHYKDMLMEQNGRDE